MYASTWHVVIAVELNLNNNRNLMVLCIYFNANILHFQYPKNLSEWCVNI